MVFGIRQHISGHTINSKLHESNGLFICSKLPSTAYSASPGHILSDSTISLHIVQQGPVIMDPLRFGMGWMNLATASNATAAVSLWAIHPRPKQHLPTSLCSLCPFHPLNFISVQIAAIDVITEELRAHNNFLSSQIAMYDHQIAMYDHLIAMYNQAYPWLRQAQNVSAEPVSPGVSNAMSNILVIMAVVIIMSFWISR